MIFGLMIFGFDTTDGVLIYANKRNMQMYIIATPTICLFLANVCLNCAPSYWDKIFKE